MPFLRLAYCGDLGRGARSRRSSRSLHELAEKAGLDAASVLQIAQGSTAEAIYAINLENAVAADVFGSPAYVLDSEVFWGQDRLDLLDRCPEGRASRLPRRR